MKPIFIWKDILVYEYLYETLNVMNGHRAGRMLFIFNGLPLDDLSTVWYLKAVSLWNVSLFSELTIKWCYYNIQWFTLDFYNQKSYFLTTRRPNFGHLILVIRPYNNNRLSKLLYTYCVN